MLHFVKYGRREHLEAFLRDGSIQLGTTYSYDEISHGSMVGDDNEGLSYTTVNDANIDGYIETGRTAPTLSGIPLFNHPGCHGNAVRITNVSYNYVILCMSRVLHRDLCLDFSAEYDSAIYVFRPFAFLHEIASAFESSGLLPDVRFRHVADIIYRDRNVGLAGLGDEIQEVFLKEPKYAHQQEIRAIWSPESEDAPTEKYYRFKAPLATAGCKLIPLEAMPTYTSETPRDEQIREFERAIGVRS